MDAVTDLSWPAPRPANEIDNAIGVLESNLRDLTAAACSGEADENASSDRIADVQRQLDALKAQRDDLA